MEDIPGNFSFLNPRDPSIYSGNRLFETGRLNLLSRFGDETEHPRISKSERVKVYLRMKPMKKDSTLTFAVPRVIEDVCVCVCVCVCLCVHLHVFEDYIASATDILPCRILLYNKFGYSETCDV
jgi:hypothetical protein